MTVFLIVTALVNIALGYGLAMYLGCPAWPSRRKAHAAEPPVEEQYHEDEEELTVVVGAKPAAVAPIAASTPAPASPVAAAPATTSVPATATPVAPVAAEKAAESPAAAAAEPELEEHVLAGIEEFRNQLAQMKAQPDAAPSQAEAAAAATV